MGTEYFKTLAVNHRAYEALGPQSRVKKQRIWEDYQDPHIYSDILLYTSIIAQAVADYDSNTDKENIIIWLNGTSEFEEVISFKECCENIGVEETSLRNEILRGSRSAIQRTTKTGYHKITVHNYDSTKRTKYSRKMKKSFILYNWCIARIVDLCEEIVPIAILVLLNGRKNKELREEYFDLIMAKPWN